MNESHPSHPNRKWPRVQLKAKVDMTFRDVAHLVSGPLDNISLGGLFIRTDEARPIGTKMTLRIHILSISLTIEAQGVVIHCIEPAEASARGRAPGMGVMFTSIEKTSREALQRLIVQEIDPPERRGDGPIS